MWVLGADADLMYLAPGNSHIHGSSSYYTAFNSLCPLSYTLVNEFAIRDSEQGDLSHLQGFCLLYIISSCCSLVKAKIVSKSTLQDMVTWNSGHKLHPTSVINRCVLSHSTYDLNLRTHNG